MPLPLPLPPTREARTSAVKVKLKQLMLDPLFWSLFFQTNLLQRCTDYFVNSDYGFICKNRILLVYYPA